MALLNPGKFSQMATNNALKSIEIGPLTLQAGPAYIIYSTLYTITDDDMASAQKNHPTTLLKPIHNPLIYNNTKKPTWF